MVIAAQVLHLTNVVQVRVARGRERLLALEHPLTTMSTDVVSWLRDTSLEETMLHFTLGPKEKDHPLELKDMAYEYRRSMTSDSKMMMVSRWSSLGRRCASYSLLGPLMAMLRRQYVLILMRICLEVLECQGWRQQRQHRC